MSDVLTQLCLIGRPHLKTMTEGRAGYANVTPWICTDPCRLVAPLGVHVSPVGSLALIWDLRSMMGKMRCSSREGQVGKGKVRRETRGARSGSGELPSAARHEDACTTP